MEIIEVSVKVESKAGEVKAQLDRKVEMALLGIGENAEGFAKEDCPVDTGRLRDDISYAVIVPEKALYIGTDVEYAVYVEYGDNAHHKVGKAHFLRDSLSTHSALYEEIARAAFDT